MEALRRSSRARDRVTVHLGVGMKWGEAVQYIQGKATAKQLRRWLDKGWVAGAMKSPGGRWFIPKEGLDRCVQQFTPSRRKKIRAVPSLSAVPADETH